MSLDAAEIDLSKAFVYGQGYVALSRVRALDGLKVLGMHPNALQVDPKVVQQDVRFHKESEAAEEAFAAMETDEVEDMHERFVVAQGGKIPKGDIESRVPAERVKQESTFAKTKTLLQEGKTIEQIVKARSLTESTVWAHVEKLAEDGHITAEDIKHLEPDDIDWETARDEFEAAIAEHGIERLKPLYEETGEKYDYGLVRLARIQHVLQGKSKEVEEVF